MLGSPSKPERQLVAGLWEDIISKGLLYRKYTISLFVYRSPFYFLSDSKLSGWQQTVLLPLVSNSSSPRRQEPACSSCEDSPSSKWPSVDLRPRRTDSSSSSGPGGQREDRRSQEHYNWWQRRDHRHSAGDARGKFPLF